MEAWGGRYGRRLHAVKILVTGAGGLLGTEMVGLGSRRADVAVVGLSRSDLDVVDASQVEATVRSHRPDVIVHAAAHTGVDAAESHREEAERVNVKGTQNVARAAREVGALLVYPSTDFVFDGTADRPYRPDDPTGPLNVYGRTKLEGERVAADVCAQHLVVRTSWVYGAGGRNFVDAILARARAGHALRVVSDQCGSPTWARNLAEGIVDLVDGGARGVFHFTDEGGVSWLEVAEEVLRLRRLDVRVEAVSSAEWGAPAQRPRYSVLDTGSAEVVLGRRMMPWRESVARYLGDAR